MPRFIHTADWQLGMTRHFLEGEAQARFSEARIDAIRSIGNLAMTQECSFVVVCGDVFEFNLVERRVIGRALEAMKATPEVTFYLLPGNHDPLDAASVFRSSAFLDRRPPNVVVLEGSDEIDTGAGISLVGAPWTSKRPLKDVVSAALEGLPADGTLRVAIGHGAVDTLSPDPNDPALIVLAAVEAAIEEGKVHYVALGDRHSTTEVGETGRIRYAGAPEPTDYREVDPGNVLVVDLTAQDISVESHHVGTWRFARKHFDLSGRADCGAVARFLEELPDKQRTIVKLALVGQLSLAEMAELEHTLEVHSEVLAALEHWERHRELVVLPDDADFDALALSGFAKEALDDLRRHGSRPDPDVDARDSGDAPEAREALRLLYRLAGVDS